MGQVANAVQFDPEFASISVSKENAQSSAKLCCILMHNGDRFPIQLDDILERSAYSFDLIRTHSFDETLVRLDLCDADLMVLGDPIADGNGMEFVRSLTTDTRTRDVPIIVVTENDSDCVAIDLLRAGAADCVSEVSVTHQRFDAAVENALRRSRRNAADHLAAISNLESENATLRRLALRNMRLLKAETLPLLSFAWQNLPASSPDGVDSRQMAKRLSRITRTVMGLIDDTVITSATHRALDVPGTVDIRQVAERIIAEDCGAIRLSSAHFRLNDLPCLFARESLVAMLLEELFISMVRNARLGHVPEIQVGSSNDPNGNPIIWFLDSGVPLSARKQALFRRVSGLNDIGPPDQDALSWSLCQRLTEKCGGEFKISETEAGQVKVSLRFPADLVRSAQEL